MARSHMTQLFVVPFPVVQAAEGQTVMLQCHYLTTNKKVERAWWEKDGKRVFGTNFPPGEIKPEAGFKGRVSLPDKALERGDFSVIVQRVRSEDGGDYRCYVQVGGQKERGTPAATRLTVNEVNQRLRGLGWSHFLAGAWLSHTCALSSSSFSSPPCAHLENSFLWETPWSYSRIKTAQTGS
uniref:Ig-like domain-containing protein n=1 Tax=Seriola dumerili TaxID=41447 RepID=A0A3B4UQP5_SERDU